MIPGSYEQILSRISNNSGLSKEEIERKIEAKRAKLSGMISKEGAAQIIAAELGMSFEREKMKISELLTGMKKINLIGKVVRINKVIEFNKNGRSGKIGSCLIADDTSNIRLVLWDTNHIALIESGKINEGDVVEISGGDIRNGEMHLSSFSDIKKSAQVIEGVVEKPVVQPKKIAEINPNDNVLVRAFVVQVFGPNFFNVCPQCKKKISELGECAEHGKVTGEKRIIINFVLDDGTESIRATLFNDQARLIASDADLASSESFMARRWELIGKEFAIEASARKNRLYENIELIINSLKEVDVSSLIEELEKKH